MKRSLHGFTLIELLVVVAIIVVLVSVLLPSLSHAREQSRTVACLTKFREVGVITQMYMSENSDFVPFVPSLSSTKPRLVNTFGSTAVQKMFSRNGVFCCDTLASQYQGFASPTTTTFQTAGLSARFNAYANAATPDPILTFKRVARPYDKIFFIDSTYNFTGEYFNWNQDGGAPDLVSQPAHNGLRNATFYDFHGETVKSSKVRSSTNVLLYRYWDPYHD